MRRPTQWWGRGNKISDRKRRNLKVWPAARALFAQLLALCLVLVVSAAASVFADWEIPFPALLLMQGVFATLLSRVLKLASWWLPIQLLMPAALALAWSWHLPPAVYLAAFMFCLALYWTTFRTQVPYYPSGPAVWSAVAALLPQSQALRVIDIGSGFGGFALHLASLRSDSSVMGVEVAPLPWLVSRLRAMLQRSAATFLRVDYNRLDFAEFDVVFAYLSPAAMPALWEKARAEMRPGSLLLSYEFPVPGAQSQIANTCGRDGAILYGWHI